jgi:hypothetical protein
MSGTLKVQAAMRGMGFDLTMERDGMHLVAGQHQARWLDDDHLLIELVYVPFGRHSAVHLLIDGDLVREADLDDEALELTATRDRPIARTILDAIHGVTGPQLPDTLPLSQNSRNVLRALLDAGPRRA